MSEVAVPASVSTGDPSPQFTVKEEMIPSGSVAVKVIVTGCPVVAGSGKTLVTDTVGTRSSIVSVI